MKFINFFKTSAPKPLRTDLDERGQQKLRWSLALQSLVAGTLGYSLYYVCRTSLNVMKKPIIDSGMLDASDLGIIGSALLFAYAIGKFVNGFLADHSNIKRFMAAGLLISTIASLVMGIIGMFGTPNFYIHGAIIPTTTVFVIFAIMWGLNGWAQSMGAAPAIIALSRWFPLSRRGTFYGIFSASHNIGEWLSFIFVGLIVATAGWQWGFFGAAIAGVIGVIIILFMMHDTPESKGLPAIEALTGEKTEQKDAKEESTLYTQLRVLCTPAVVILAFSSAFMYISRYSLNSWGILFLQEQKGYELTDATFVVSINALLGIPGTLCAGFLSDFLFKGDRKMPALVSGILLSLSYVLFIYGGNAYWVNILSMVLFGLAIGVLIAFLGGLMAIDLVPRKATGAALGIVGCASYIAAGVQDVVSGSLIDAGNDSVASEMGVAAAGHDFSLASIFWISASVISFLLIIVIMIMQKFKKEDNFYNPNFHGWLTIFLWYGVGLVLILSTIYCVKGIFGCSDLFNAVMLALPYIIPIIVVGIATIVAVNRRKRNAVSLARTFLIMLIIDGVCAIAMKLFAYITTDAALEWTSLSFVFGKNIILSVLWLVYLHKSKVVKQVLPVADRKSGALEKVMLVIFVLAIIASVFYIFFL